MAGPASVGDHIGALEALRGTVGFAGADVQAATAAGNTGDYGVEAVFAQAPREVRELGFGLLFL